MISPFTVARIPKLLFGENAFHSFVDEVRKDAFETADPRGRVAVISGRSWFPGSFLEAELKEAVGSRRYRAFAVSGEPSPESVDRIVDELRAEQPTLVVAIGGGSVVDTGKAVSAMVPVDGSVAEYLEGVGSKKPAGRKIPFVAIPTTSGTGSEATKNAVISRIGPDGFKKSLRHDAYVPDMAVVDPAMVRFCPPHVTAASGLDAVTQLLEGFVSTNASPFTDALAREGLRQAGRYLVRAVGNGGDLEARTAMALAAYLSGIVLANAGLGVIHGIASPLGAAVRIPHGVVCGTLAGEASRVIVDQLRNGDDDASGTALGKYAEAGVLLGGDVGGESGGETVASAEKLVRKLEKLIDELDIPPLRKYGIDEKVAERVADASGIKNTPVDLSKEDILRIILSRLGRSSE